MIIFGGLMIAAIIYGFFMSVPDVVAEMSGAVAVACFVVLFLVYLAMFILIVSAVVNSLYDIRCAKFWAGFHPFSIVSHEYCLQRREYSADKR